MVPSPPADGFLVTIKSPSMAAPLDRDDGMRSPPGDSRSTANSWKCTRMVQPSRVTRTRPAPAATCTTFASVVPSAMMPEECRKSRDGSRRLKLLPMSGSRSASARKEILKARLTGFSLLRSAESLYQLHGHPMLRLDFLENTIPILQVRIHFRRVFPNKGDRPVDLG